MRRCIVIVLVFLLSFNGFGEKSKISEKVKGIWYNSGESESPLFEWKAAWIWADENLETDAIFARRTFSLENAPEKTILRITASSQYQLYINGEYICRGPARCAPHHQSYDILDVSSLLKTGENVLAVRVHHQDGKRSYQYEGRAGLLAQLDINDDKTILTSDSNWKVLADPSWDNNAPKISRFQQIVNDRVDFRKYLKGWNTLGFDDSNWSDARKLMRKVGWPAPQKNAKAQPLTPPWTSLVPRDIPYLIEKDIKAEKLIEAVQTETSINKNPIILTGKMELEFSKNKLTEIPATTSGNSWLVLFDFGEVINGMPKLDIQGTEGTEVEIVTAPFMVDKQFTHKTVDSEFRDIIILSGERDKWEATYFKPTRYLGIIVRNAEPVKLYSAGIHQIKYPFEISGQMSSTDAPWIKDYFDASAKTINVCTTDAFTDNYRERRQYAQTGYYASLGNYFTFGDVSLQRRYLIQTAQEQLANGIMPAYAPAAADDYMIILDSNCLWIRGLRNYLLFSGDEKTVKELLPAAKKLMALLHSYTNTFEMIDNPPYAYWLDHAVNDRRGANINLNGHYLGALDDFAEMLSWLKEPESNKFQERANLLRQSLQKKLWDSDQQLFADAFIDGKRSGMFSEHANAMALALNVATPQQAGKIAKQLLVNDNNNYIKRVSGVTMVTPAMSYFLHKGLCEYGFVDESFELFRRRFNKMLEPSTNQTLWEEWWLDGTGRTGKFQGGRTRSDAQTESAFPPALFAEYLLGVKPIRPGMKEMTLSRTHSALKNIEGEIPTPEGILGVKWNVNKNSGDLQLDIPGEMVVKLDLKSLNLQAGKQINIDGNRKIVSENDELFLTLSAGKHKVEF
ncbi:MAG: family 78 glycoside hydrolase catalytic domain [Prolixibacteraceae bacterium]|nr:family 78 glycoside hydrolase catalytic domain [Prolixibacteraceae bacterium]